MDFKTDLFQFFKPNTLYEGILCSRYIGSDYINAACMGFRITESAEIVVTPYFETDTIKNLNEGTLFSLHISDDPVKYAIASLYGWHKGAFEPEFDLSLYDTNRTFPILKNTNIAVIAKVESISAYSKNGILTGNKINAKVEQLVVNSTPRNHSSREFSLILESLISATRAKIAKEKANEPEKLFYYSSLSDIFTKLRRFSMDPAIFEAVSIIKKWILKNIDDEFERQWDPT